MPEVVGHEGVEVVDNQYGLVYAYDKQEDRAVRLPLPDRRQVGHVQEHA